MASSSFAAAAAHSSVIKAKFAYRGIGCSDKAYVIDHSLPPDIAARTCPAEEIPEQVEIFRNAVSAAVKQYAELIKTCNEKLSPDYGQQIEELMNFYTLMLQDEGLQSEIIDRITGGTGPAETCVQIVMEEKAREFAAQDDPSFAAKQDDIRAMADRIIRNILRLPFPDISQAPLHAIIIADTLSPTDAVYFEMLKPAGLILGSGSPSGHIADVARGLHIPCAFVSSRAEFDALKEGSLRRAPILDGRTGEIITEPSVHQRSTADTQKRLIRQREINLGHLNTAKTQDANGHDFSLFGTAGNIMDIRELVQHMGIDHIGLWRTEMVVAGGTVPSVEDQIKTYSAAFAYAQGGTVRARTFDFVGDKAFVGDRSPEQKYADIKNQIRALLIAAGDKDITLEIMIPNIRLIEEVKDCKKILENAYAELKEEGQAVPAELPRFGIMLETPSAINNIKRIAPLIDFVSVGMNDATANFMACDREDPHHAIYQDPLTDELLDYFQELFEKLNDLEISYSLCGAPAADETLIPIWYAMGVRALSVPYGSVLEARQCISKLDRTNTAQLFHALREASYEDRRTILNAFCQKHNIGFASALQTAPEAAQTYSTTPS